MAEVLKTVGDVRRKLARKPDNYPIAATYHCDSGCDTDGGWDAAGELVVHDLETCFVFEVQEPEDKRVDGVPVVIERKD